MENRDIQHKLMHLQMLLKKWHMKNRVDHGPFADPMFGQGRVLALLKMQESISTRDLSFLLNIRMQSLNELLNKLEKSGYVEKSLSEEDKRVTIIHLTNKGRDAAEKSPEIDSPFDTLNPEELSQFGEYLDRIIDELEEKVGSDEDERLRREWMEKARKRMSEPMFEQMSKMHHYGQHNFVHRPNCRFYINN
ncbi:MarR family winged helix-turn-helix transcriptional regulator [Xylocopilactobacillus apicola]|uniref:MarR family transcriptional regulator n=1 Tax=Xylocopilactobacillus apicola TaxID=2932184 RepID=A0AAU9DNM5_9LACO|nr:MarR family transcriptional regulator [Xylocopilactobacillus apicola]BDR58692.1 MarR family transcriptional regulator [Xylocopilactobacillus apicola]